MEVIFFVTYCLFSFTQGVSEAYAILPLSIVIIYNLASFIEKKFASRARENFSLIINLK
jgi:hypothetical protein